MAEATKLIHVRRITFAALAGAFAVIARAVMQPVWGDEVPFGLAFPTIVATGLLWGTPSAVVAAGVCALGVWMPSIPPTIDGPHQLAYFGWFAAAALCTAVLCGYLRGRRASTASIDLIRPPDTPLGAWLRTVLWGALLVPLAAFVAASWWSLDRAEAASAANLSHASNLAFRHAERTFAIAQEIARRADQASQFPEEEIRAREPEIHLRLSDMAAGLSSVVNANVWDKSGAILARSDRYPVDPGFTIADRQYFQQLRASPTPVAISEVLVGRQSGTRVVSVAIRRSVPEGSFDGIVTVTLAPGYFRDYYRSLAHEEPTLATFALVRTDGAILARWPDDSASTHLPQDGPLMRLLSTGPDTGRLTIAADGGRGTQIVQIERVGGLPVYVVAGISRSAMLGNWARVVGVLAAIILPITAGLVYVTWVALRKTRKEASVSAELREQIQARAEAERRMLEAQRLETLSFVTGSVAHDFNNLLAVISSSVHVLKIRRPEVASDKTLAAISRSVQGGVRLTRQLLSFSKKQALRPEVIRFQTWLPAADALMRSTVGSPVSWTSLVDADTRQVRVDPAELELALLNVVLNAKLAMPQGGKLSVHVSNDEKAPLDAPMVIVCVIDDGEGIPPEVLPKVFAPFFTTRERGVGSGLGLTQVQAFCVQSGGRATIVSELGQGTTVCMHLPATSDANTESSEVTSAASRRLQARLLLVEDNEEVGATTEQMLQSSGVSVARVASADAALDYLVKANPFPEIVLSDIAMPGSMNGIGLALELRRLYPTLPVILHTGYAEQIDEGTAKGLRVFHKPVPPDVLLAELDALLRGTGPAAMG
ncbi:ATP-binding protein [Variovorax sp. J31P179]|uniref:hybrid sensor histidine kinase/response regulator n=1 Tax=Variovorax sp. J31P179 TaxID=3053508 RepID=UPI00257599D5|nr:hybrid sensor histidine kinase/response regulator [Variovorax sp. J31P179]MDM0085701.1 ATP-binding protein [Variovorax sp. J31P179]